MDSDGVANKITLRGPNILGLDMFNPYCVFSNDAKLKEHHVEYLKTHVNHHKPAIPYYLCTMNNSIVISRKNKMTQLLYLSYAQAPTKNLKSGSRRVRRTSG